MAYNYKMAAAQSVTQGTMEGTHSALNFFGDDILTETKIHISCRKTSSFFKDK